MRAGRSNNDLQACNNAVAVLAHTALAYSSSTGHSVDSATSVPVQQRQKH
jgi:hypothetical protein